MNKLLVVAGTLALLSGSARAKDGNFAKEHPRRAQVIHRENKDKRKFDKQEDSGKITAGQEKKLDREENGIRAQERAEAQANGGHITKGEQRQLNREERRVERQDRRMKRRDAAKKDGNPGGNTGKDNGVGNGGVNNGQGNANGVSNNSAQ